MATDRDMLDQINQRVAVMMDALVQIAGQLTAQVDIIRQMQQQMEGAGGESDLADDVKTIVRNTAGIQMKLDHFYDVWRTANAQGR